MGESRENDGRRMGEGWEKAAKSREKAGRKQGEYGLSVFGFLNTDRSYRHCQVSETQTCQGLLDLTVSETFNLIRSCIFG